MSSSEAHELTRGNPDRPTDQEVMAAIRVGDRDALQLLIDRYWARLLRSAESMVGCRDTAEDIAQEVFVRIWKYRARWKSGRSPWGYLFRIARNLVLDRSQLRGIRESKERDVRRLFPPARLPLEEVQYRELRAALDEALLGLPERRREAFLLVRMKGLTLAEAAAAMGVGRQTVANHVHLAVMDLRRALARFLP